LPPTAGFAYTPRLRRRHIADAQLPLSRQFRLSPSHIDTPRIIASRAAPADFAARPYAAEGPPPYRCQLVLAIRDSCRHVLHSHFQPPLAAARDDTPPPLRQRLRQRHSFVKAAAVKSRRRRDFRLAAAERMHYASDDAFVLMPPPPPPFRCRRRLIRRCHFAAGRRHCIFASRRLPQSHCHAELCRH